VRKSDSRVREAEGRGHTSPKKPSGSAEAGGKRRGRPPGKRSDPDFVQTTAYVRGDTYKAVRIALIQEDEGREYSELVEELLSKWLKSRK
jgi:hypothetical protein